MCNNPKVDLVNLNLYTKFGQIHLFILKIFSWSKILTSIKGHNSNINLGILTWNNPNLDLVYKIWSEFCTQDLDPTTLEYFDRGLLSVCHSESASFQHMVKHFLLEF